MRTYKVNLPEGKKKAFGARKGVKVKFEFFLGKFDIYTTPLLYFEKLKKVLLSIIF